MWRGCEGPMHPKFKEDFCRSITWKFGLEKEAMERNLFAGLALTRGIDFEVTLSTVNLELILAWLVMEFTLWLVSHPAKHKDIASMYGNSVGDSSENSSGTFRHEIEKMISFIGGQIISESRSHFSLVMSQLVSLRKDMEIV